MTTANGDADATIDPDLEAGLDALFRGPRERFVTERNALAKRLRTRGRGERAAWVKGLAKPSVSAWAVSQLWWTRGDEVRALRAAGARQRDVLRRGAGPAEQAAASREQRRIRDQLVEAATTLLAEAGHAAGASTLRRISTTLEALAAHGPEGPHPGRLSEDLDPPGFDLLGGLAATTPMSEPSPSPEPPPPPAPTDDEAEREALAAIAEAERAVDDVRARAQDAARALDEITREAEATVQRAERADAEHERAVLAAARAQEAAAAAMLEARRTRTEAGTQRERLEHARRTLEHLTAEQRQLEQVLQQARQRRAERDDG